MADTFDQQGGKKAKKHRGRNRNTHIDDGILERDPEHPVAPQLDVVIEPCPAKACLAKIPIREGKQHYGNRGAKQHCPHQQKGGQA